ncbi:hypothetical protein ACYSNS_14490, partial [Bartonella sp. LJL80]
MKKTLLGSVSFICVALSCTQPLWAESLSVSNGSTVTVDGKTYTSTGATYSGSAVLAIGASSKILGSNLTISDGGIPVQSGTLSAPVFAYSGGRIELADSKISGANAIAAQYSGSQVVMNGGAIDTQSTVVGDVVSGVQVRNGGSVTLNNVTFTGNNGYYAGNVGSFLTVNGGTMQHVAMTGSAINIYEGAGGLIDGTKVSSTGAAFDVGSGMSDRSSATARNFDFTTTGQDGSGGVVTANFMSSITLSNGKLTSTSDSVAGIWATGFASTGDRRTEVVGDRLTIVTQGVRGYGVTTYQSSVTLTNSDISVHGQSSNGVYADARSLISLTHGSIKVTGSSSTGVQAFNVQSSVILNDVTVDLSETATNSYATSADFQSSISVEKSQVSVLGENSSAINILRSSNITLTDTNVTVSGANGNGIVYQNSYKYDAQNVVTIIGGSLDVQNGYAVTSTQNDSFTDNAANTLILKDTTLSGGKGLVNITQPSKTYATKVAIDADNSKLFGASHFAGNTTLDVALKNNSVWTVTRPDSEDGKSAVSSLSLNNSTLAFSAPVDDIYQQLTTAKLDMVNGNVTLNTYLNTGGSLSNQFTDRLLVNGDVTGTATVNIVTMAGSPGGATSVESFTNEEGISIIQVSGQAAENSFALAGGYVTMNEKPYQYSIYAYGPGSSRGEAADDQRLVSGTTPYWDYRLQSVYVEPPVPPVVPPVDPTEPPVDPVDPNGGGNGGGTTPPVKAVAPQLASYLVAPTA